MYNGKSKFSFDQTDITLMSMMIRGLQNQDMADKLKMPVSTVQRRTRRLLESGVIKSEVVIDFKMLGLKKGLLHVYLLDGKLKEMSYAISELEGIVESSIHMGNSDIVAEFIYENDIELMNIYTKIKDMSSTDHILWSSEVTNTRAGSKTITPVIERAITNNNHNVPVSKTNDKAHDDDIRVHIRERTRDNKSSETKETKTK